MLFTEDSAADAIRDMQVSEYRSLQLYKVDPSTPGNIQQLVSKEGAEYSIAIESSGPAGFISVIRIR